MVNYMRSDAVLDFSNIGCGLLKNRIYRELIFKRKTQEKIGNFYFEQYCNLLWKAEMAVKL